MINDERSHKKIKKNQRLLKRLYTDENPKDKVSINFGTPADARKKGKGKNI